MRRFALTVLKYVVVLGVFVISSVADTMREEGGGAEGVCVSCGVYDESGGVAKLSSEQRSQFSSCASSGNHPADTACCMLALQRIALLGFCQDCRYLAFASE